MIQTVYRPKRLLMELYGVEYFKMIRPTKFGKSRLKALSSKKAKKKKRKSK